MGYNQVDIKKENLCKLVMDKFGENFYKPHQRRMASYSNNYKFSIKFELNLSDILSFNKFNIRYENHIYDKLYVTLLNNLKNRSCTKTVLKKGLSQCFLEDLIKNELYNDYTENMLMDIELYKMFEDRVYASFNGYSPSYNDSNSFKYNSTHVNMINSFATTQNKLEGFIFKINGLDLNLGVIDNGRNNILFSLSVSYDNCSTIEILKNPNEPRFKKQERINKLNTLKKL